MKPIKLKITGINSFVEEQTIDFKDLCERGLFGIFGPTGSGKSTVLDGITLALYGEVARKSSNYINAKRDKGYVSYEFQISGATPKRYLVEREFKRDKKTGGINSGNCRLMLLGDSENEVLADKVREVNAKCQDIIGLSLDDFTRTVVLPQGKFSEFLKLEGKPRREMLERLFNLQQYGEDLSRKLSSETGKERANNNVIEGQLKGFEDITTSRKKELEEEVDKKKNELSDTKNKLSKVNAIYDEGKELWALQKQLEDLHNKQTELLSQKDKINDSVKKVETSEKSSQIIPLIESYEEAVKSENIAKKTLDDIVVRLDVAKLKKEKCDKNWQEISDKRDNELPKLMKRQGDLTTAQSEKILLDKADAELVTLRGEKSNNEDKLKNNTIQTNEQIISQKNIQSLIASMQSKVNKLKIDAQYKTDIYRGKDIEINLHNLKALIEKSEENIAQTDILISNANDEIFTYKAKKMDIENKLEAVVNDISNNKPEYTSTDLADAQVTIQAFELSKANYDKLDKDLADIATIIESSEKLLKEKKKQKLALEDMIADLDIKIKKIMTESMAKKLRESLSDGEVCPVCGSVHHLPIHFEETEDEAPLQDKLGKLNNKLDLIKAEIVKLQTQIDNGNEKTKEINAEELTLEVQLAGKTKETLTRKYIKIKNSIDEYELRAKSLSDEEKRLSKSLATISEKLNGLEKEIQKENANKDKLVNELKTNNAEYDLFNLQYQSLKRKTGAGSFMTEADKIAQTESERDGLQEQIDKKREEEKTIVDIIERLKSEATALGHNIAAYTSQIEGKESYRNEKLTKITEIVKDLDTIGDELKTVTDEINHINSESKRIQTERDTLDNEYNTLNKQHGEAETKLTGCIERKADDEKRVADGLKNNGFNSMDEVKKALILPEKLAELRKQITDYNNDVEQIKGAVKTVNDSIAGRNITEADWINVQNEKTTADKQYEELNKECIELSQSLKALIDKLEELKDIQKAKDKSDHKLAVLRDLESLFKGKKFVEYVAAERLRYISKQASDRLMTISNGNYGLKVDENGKFIIIDNKNGGAFRDASTLSGGETFITSLALALALSTEIQLKGKAPLELFFLDEGFGSLDDNLLDVVMNSLEKIHHDKLSVGIITHVESIKNRVPIKLVLTPAQLGSGGSKVRMEIS